MFVWSKEVTEQMLAPIGISTYSRLDHLKKTIRALQKNTLALNSELYIFSDAPKKHDEMKVDAVRKYIRTIDGFKNVHIINREQNCRVTNNRDGMKQLLDQYGQMIFLEEDIVTAPGFLCFMNRALEYYSNDPRILSITGHSPPFKISKSYTEEVFLLKRFDAWGFATWSDRFDPYGFNLSDDEMNMFLCSKKRIKEFKQNGADLYRMLLAENKNEIDALDVKIMFYQYINDMYTLYPSRSLVQNIGLDGTGVHCVATDEFEHKTLWLKRNKFIFKKQITVDELIRKEHYIFRSPKFRERVVNVAKWLGLKKY